MNVSDDEMEDKDVVKEDRLNEEDFYD